MAIMTGSLRDFAYRRLNYNTPRITFTPSGPGVRADTLFATMPVRVTPDEEGAFSVNLEPTAGVTPQVWYSITLEWSDSSGNFQSQDNPDWVLVVPPGGGAVAKNIAVVKPDRIITKGDPGDASEVTVEAARGAAADAIAAADVLYANDPRVLRSVESQEYAIPFLDESGYVAGGVQKDASFNFEKAPRVEGETAVTLAPINDIFREWAIPFTDADGYVAGGLRRDGTWEFLKTKGGGAGGLSAVELANEMAGFSRSSKKRISCIGDSMTNGYFDGAGGKTADSYPTKLQSRLGSGVEVFNLSTSGLAVDEVAARIGAFPLPLALTGGSIPASGDVAATTTATVGWGIATGYNGSLAGVPGRLTRTEGSKNAFTFRRTTAGSAVPVPAGTVFVPDSVGHDKDTLVIFLGRNDVSQQITGGESSVVDHVVEGVMRIVNWASPTIKQVLVIGVLTSTNEVTGTGGHSTIKAIEQRLKGLLPSRFLNLRRYLIDRAIYDLGITPTAADLEKIAGDTLPPSIMDPGDSTHYSRATADLVAAQVYEYLTTRGWV